MGCSTFMDFLIPLVYSVPGLMGYLTLPQSRNESGWVLPRVEKGAESRAGPGWLAPGPTPPLTTTTTPPL